MATVTINGLMCQEVYNITAGGTLDGVLVGPRSSHGTITAGPCPPMITTTTVATTSMTSKEELMLLKAFSTYCECNQSII